MASHEVGAHAELGQGGVEQASEGDDPRALEAEVQAAIEDALRRIRASGKAAGILARGEEGARRWIGAGCNFVAVGVDAVLLAQAADGLAAKFRT